MSHGILQNLADIRARITAAEKAAGRAAGSVTLVAVTKTFGPEAVEQAAGAGQTAFGENRVQEAEGKYPALKDRHPGIELHLIGPLQSNKTAEAVALFDVIHTVDRPKIAAELAKEIRKQGRVPRLFVQLNTGAEPQKAGVLPQEADAFIAACRTEYGLMIEGLMCIPPAEENPAPHFALLEKIARRNGLAGLSMGMSADFESAIAFGATYVRVGSAIFGAR
jgi:PLP dependent protein